MSAPQTVASILRERVMMEVESIDRLYLNVCRSEADHSAHCGESLPGNICAWVPGGPRD